MSRVLWTTVDTYYPADNRIQLDWCGYELVKDFVCDQFPLKEFLHYMDVTNRDEEIDRVMAGPPSVLKVRQMNGLLAAVPHNRLAVYHNTPTKQLLGAGVTVDAEGRTLTDEIKFAMTFSMPFVYCSCEGLDMASMYWLAGKRFIKAEILQHLDSDVKIGRGKDINLANCAGCKPTAFSATAGHPLYLRYAMSLSSRCRCAACGG